MEPFINAIAIARELVRRIASEWKIFLLTFFLCLVFVIAATLIIGKKYTSEMTVTAVSANQSMLGGLAGAAGLLSSGSISSLATSILNPASALDNYQSLVQSNVVSEALMSKYHIQNRIFGDAVDPKTGTWKPTLSRDLKQLIYGVFGLQLSDAPTIDDVALKLNEMIVVTQSSQDQNTINISCTSRDSGFCYDLLREVHQEVEYRLNSLELEQAQRTAKYVTSQLPRTQIAEVREAMIEVLASAEKTIATTALSQPVAGIVLDPPIRPTRPSFPRPTLLLVIAGFLGLIISCLVTWTIVAARERRSALAAGNLAA
jgi:hypothetical protein